MLTPEYVCKITDAIAKVRQDTIHADSFVACAQIIEESVWDSRDKQIHKYMAGVSDNLHKNGSVDKLHTGMLFPAIRGLEMLATSSRSDGKHFRSLPEFCRHFNIGIGGSWSALLHPSFVELYELIYTNRKVDGYNIYPPSAQLFATGNGTRTIVESVNPAVAAGCVRLAAVTHSAVSVAAGDIYVTGIARKADGSIQNGSWTARGVMLNGDSTYFLTADIAGDICLSVNSVLLPGGYQSGDIGIWGYEPEGRL